MSGLIPGVFNQDKINFDPFDYQQLNEKPISDQTDSEELKAQLRDLDPKLVGDEEGRYTGIARIIPRCVVNAFYHISNLWNHNKITALESRISKLEADNPYASLNYTELQKEEEPEVPAPSESEEFDYSDFTYSSDLDDSDSDLSLTDSSEFEIDEELEQLFTAGGTYEELEARKKELLRKRGYDSCDEEQDVSDDFEEDSIVQRAAPPSSQLKGNEDLRSSGNLPTSQGHQALSKAADKVETPQELSPAAAPQSKKSKKKKRKQKNMEGFPKEAGKLTSKGRPSPLNQNVSSPKNSQEKPSSLQSREVELLQVSQSPLREEVVVSEEMPQIQENQAMKRLEAFDHPFITEKFTEENVQNVENVDGGIKITLKDNSVITAKREEGKLVLTGDGIHNFAENYFKSQFDCKDTFNYFWNRYLKGHTLQALEVQENQSIRIISNAPIDSNKCRSDLEQATQNNSFDIKGEHPLIDFKEVKTITQQTRFQGSGENAKFELIGRWDLKMKDETQLMVERAGNEGLKLSGSAIQILMKTQLQDALGENHNTFLPLDKIQSVFVSYTYDKQNPNKLRIDFDQKLKGTTNQVQEGGWQDMKHNQIVMEKSLDINIYPGVGVLFEKGKMRMGIHIEDYEFLVNLPTAVTGTHTVLYKDDYTQYWQPKAKNAMEFSMEISGLTQFKDDKKNKTTFVLQGKVESEENTLEPRRNTDQIDPKPIFDTFAFNGYEPLGIPGLKDVPNFPLPEEVYQDSFAHFEWQALPE